MAPENGLLENQIPIFQTIIFGVYVSFWIVALGFPNFPSSYGSCIQADRGNLVAPKTPWSFERWEIDVKDATIH